MIGIVLGTLALPGPAAVPDQKSPSRELQELYDDDQRDQKTPDADALTRAFLERQVARRDRVVQILGESELHEPLDLRNAALLLQHGQEVDDYLLAHVLATAAIFDADVPFGKFLCAATLDRYLLRLKRPQAFGTQATDPTAPGGGAPAVGVAIAKEFGVGAGTEQGGGGRSKRDRKEPQAKDLPARFREMQRDAKRAGAEEEVSQRRRTRVAWALELVREGEIAKSEQWFQAASILAEGTEPEELLTAHVAAIVAGTKGHKNGPRLAAETLDHWLLSISRPQRFGTHGEAGVPVEPFDGSWPDWLRKPYGLKPIPPAREREKVRR